MPRKSLLEVVKKLGPNKNLADSIEKVYKNRNKIKMRRIDNPKRIKTKERITA